MARIKGGLNAKKKHNRTLKLAITSMRVCRSFRAEEPVPNSIELLSSL